MRVSCSKSVSPVLVQIETLSGDLVSKMLVNVRSMAFRLYPSTT